MSDIYLYNNEMWRMKSKYVYTGEPQSFTLPTGRYLCICKGARGGMSRIQYRNKGGCSYGILNLQSPLEAYAVVGGNGEDSVFEDGVSSPGAGGYNGGGRGGLSCDQQYYSGGGGGGASDIRLSLAPPIVIPGRIHQVPDYFDEIEYLESTGYQTMDIQSIHKANTRIECECEIIENSDRTWETIFGARNGGMGAQLVFFGRFGDVNIPCFGCNGWEVQGSNLVYDQPIKIVIEGNTASWYDDQDQLIDSIVCEYGDQVNGENNMYLFNMNSGGSPDGSNSKVKIKSFKMTTDGQLVRYLVPFKNNGYSIDTTNIPFESGTISASSGQNNDDPRYYNQIRSVGYVEWDPAWTYFNIAAIIDGANTMHFVDYYDENHNFLGHNNWHTCNPSDRYQVLSGTRYIRILLGDWNGPMIDETHLDSLAIYGYATTAASGMYDLISERFFTKGDWDSDFVTGPIVSDRTQYREYETIDVSALSRIMVAGGGGGGASINADNFSEFSGYGGGANGGYPFTLVNYPEHGLIATQTSGYAFGRGQDAVDRNQGGTSPYGAEGHGGGGGGWYGGYTSSNSDTYEYSTANGGGGSGYVLTQDSYKPEEYMRGLEPRNDLNFSNTLMTSGLSDGACVIICEPVATYSIGDRLICDNIGSGTSFPLFPGTYNVKCAGGCGSHRYNVANVARGGYAEGTFTNPDATTAYAYVGGIGLYCAVDKNTAYVQSTHPTARFNGGGSPSTYGSAKLGGEAGGGGTDLRIGTDSLYARIIVAGGGGGSGKYYGYGGDGGGSTGGENQNGGYGSNYGPGTQTAPGSGAIAGISGTFGSGGWGSTAEEGYGGAGGGGWYGGSGTGIDVSSDDNKGGCGGSGYVLTQSSYKPEGYLLDESYYMTDTSLVTGGADTLCEFPLTGMIITVINVENMGVLCYDADGYKYFDKVNNRWAFLQTAEPDESDFQDYGVSSFPNDTGLRSEYSLCVYDDADSINTVTFNVLPPKQDVQFRYNTSRIIGRYTIDSDVDDAAVDFNVETYRSGMAEDAYIQFKFEYDIHDVPEKDTRVYCIQAYTQPATTGYQEPNPKPKTLQHIDLLPVGSATRMPTRYKNYIGSFINVSEAITEINSAVCCEHNRCIYSATLCNNKVIRIAKLNLVTNTSTIIKDIPKLQIGSYIGDIKVSDDYIYLTPAENNSGLRCIWRTPNSSDPTVTTYRMDTNSENNNNAHGKMFWYNNHTLAILIINGIALFDTESNTFSYMKNQGPHQQSSERRDFVLGNEYALTFSTAGSQSAYVFDIETGICYGLIEDFDQTWTGAYKNCACYNDGTFYVVQRNRLHFLDEHTMTITKSIPTPFTTVDPKQIVYGDGILYITIEGSSSLYMYDLNTEIFYAAGLPFPVDNSEANGWISMCAFKGYCFAPQMKLYVINFTNRAKYSLGYKYDQFVIPINAASAADPDNRYIYDPTFVTFTPDNMWIHAGDLVRSLVKDSPESNIKRCSMDKSLYNKLIKTSFSFVEPNVDNDEDESEGT